MAGAKWTKEDEERLSHIYPIYGDSPKLIEFFPNRTRKAIAVRAIKLGFKVINPWNKKKTTDSYSKEISKYNISVVKEYINDATVILHKCNVCSTEWPSKPNNILNGSGCPTCHRGYGWAYGRNIEPINAFLYVLKIHTNKDSFIKVGITSQHTDKRIYEIKSEIGKSNLVSCDILHKYESTGKDVLELESNILYNQHLIKHNSFYKFKGYTETFNVSELPIIMDIINTWQQHLKQ